MSEASGEMKPAKREREERAAAEEHVKEADAPVAKRIKADNEATSLATSSSTQETPADKTAGTGATSTSTSAATDGDSGTTTDADKMEVEAKDRHDKEDIIEEGDERQVEEGVTMKAEQEDNVKAVDGQEGVQTNEMEGKRTGDGENVSEKKEGEDEDGGAKREGNEGSIKNDTVETSDKLKEKEEASDKIKEKEEESLSKAEADAEALKMLEFYFGDSNFNWDRFMQGKAGKMGEGFIDISVLLTFNKLKTIAKKAGLDDDGAKDMVARLAGSSESLKVNEDKSQIGRAKALTEEAVAETMGRTVQTKGWKRDANITIQDVEKVFQETGNVIFVKICRAGSRKLTSIFVEFEKKEEADLAVQRSEQFTHDGELISVRMASRDGGEKSDKSNAADAADGEPQEPDGPKYDPGKIVHVVGIPESGVTRETLKESFKPYGKVLFVDFSIGKNEALLRMEKPSEAADAVEGTKEEGLSLGKDVEAKGVVSLLQGEAEKEFYERFEIARAGWRNRNRGRAKGRSGRGRGGGRGGRGKGGR